MSDSFTDANFNYTATAEGYSQVAGVLAGFAFSAILLAVTRKALRHDEGLGQLVAAFMAAFFGLVLASVGYAVMSGEVTEPTESGRLAIEEVLNGLAFGISILTLMYGVVLLLQSERRLEHAAVWAERVTATFGPMITLLLLLTGGQDIESVRRTDSSASLANGAVGGWQLGGYIVVAIGLGGLVLQRLLRDRLPRMPTDQNIVSSFVLGLTITAAIAHSGVSIVYDNTLVPPAYMAFALLTVCALAVNGFSFLILATRPAAARKKRERRNEQWQPPKSRGGAPEAVPANT